ncbi:MAG: hypothetical protein RL220_122 [Bacteroidota bacterium]
MGSRLLYYLVIKPISLLPYPVLYFISDFFFVVFFYLVGYRKAVVLDNLQKCFPDKPEKEILKIRRAFYRHFCDMVLESLKNFSVSPAEAAKRMVQENPELVDELAQKHGGVVLCAGHYANWELWAVAAPLGMKTKILGIYKKLSNAFFDEVMRNSRSKTGLLLVSTRDTGNYLRTHEGEPLAIAFAFDQSPANPEKCYWLEFMGRETAALYGAEKYAKDFGYPVVFGDLKKTSRGHYSVKYSIITTSPSTEGYGDILKKLYRLLEDQIKARPEFYLWSHRRWKHKRPLSTTQPK